jgi:proline iminopeptidase
MNRRTLLGGGVGAVTLAARSIQADAPVTGVKAGGERLIPIEGGKYRVWTRKVGSSGIKVLTLHGGPGFNHLYLNCFEDFLPQAGIEFYLYDQLGSLFSDNPDDPRLWTLARYTDEVEQVRQGLGLENFYLYGHSWGGMLAYEYALKYPQHLRGVIVSNMVASLSRYEAYVAQFKNELTPIERKTLEKYEAAHNYDAPEYQKIVQDRIYAKHICRLDSWPAPVELSFRFLNAKIYNYLQGPNEFVITGTLKNWDRSRELKNIKTRALIIGARYDEMDPGEMRRVASAMPNARAVISDRGSHFSMYDDQAWYFRELINFLKQG